MPMDWNWPATAIAAALCMELNANLFKKYGGSQFEGLVKQLPTLRYLDHVHGLISWLVAYTRMAGAADFAVDSFETVIAGLPTDKLAPNIPRCSRAIRRCNVAVDGRRESRG